MLREKRCTICGKKFLGRPNRMYCSPACRAKSQSKAYKEEQESKVKKKSETRILSIEEINRRARAEGLSYGQYMAKYYWS